MEKNIFDIIAKANEILESLRLSRSTIRAYQARSFAPIIKAYEEYYDKRGKDNGNRKSYHIKPSERG